LVSDIKEEHKLRVFGNRVLRIFGSSRGEETGGWRKLHKEQFRDLYSSPSISRMIKPRRMRWAGHVARMGEKKNVHRSEGRRRLGRPRRRWVDNINMDFLKRGWGGMDWIGLAQDRYSWRALMAVMNLRGP
jgi:hypothetical protein